MPVDLSVMLRTSPKTMLKKSFEKELDQVKAFCEG